MSLLASCVAAFLLFHPHPSTKTQKKTKKNSLANQTSTAHICFLVATQHNTVCVCVSAWRECEWEVCRAYKCVHTSWECVLLWVWGLLRLVKLLPRLKIFQTTMCACMCACVRVCVALVQLTVGWRNTLSAPIPSNQGCVRSVIEDRRWVLQSNHLRDGERRLLCLFPAKSWKKGRRGHILDPSK